MKPLNKLEKEMFEAITGWEYEEAKVTYGHTNKSLFDNQEKYARDCAKVAVDLAKRAHSAGFDSGMKYGSYSMSELPDDIDSGLKNPECIEFLKSEGIEP